MIIFLFSANLFITFAKTKSDLFIYPVSPVPSFSYLFILSVPSK